jgi:hypothetical protein
LAWAGSYFDELSAYFDPSGIASQLVSMIGKRTSQVSKSIGNCVAESGDTLYPVGAYLRRHLVSIAVHRYPPHISILARTQELVNTASDVS